MALTATPWVRCWWKLERWYILVLIGPTGALLPLLRKTRVDFFFSIGTVSVNVITACTCTGCTWLHSHKGLMASKSWCGWLYWLENASIIKTALSLESSCSARMQSASTVWNTNQMPNSKKRHNPAQRGHTELEKVHVDAQHGLHSGDQGVEHVSSDHRLVVQSPAESLNGWMTGESGLKCYIIQSFFTVSAHSLWLRNTAVSSEALGDHELCA